MPNHHGTILVVDDEPAVDELIAELLTQAGYQVLIARHVIEALHVCKRHPEPIHLLLTDVNLPSMNGRELATRARAFRPQMRILYMSGQDHNQFIDEAGVNEALAFVQKPFNLDNLLQKVRWCLREVSDFGCV